MQHFQESERPDTIERECGGWIAVAQRGAPFRIAVTASTEDEAIDRFRVAHAKWAAALDPAARSTDDPL